MATNLSTAFKNNILNWITGAATPSNATVTHVLLYSGVSPGDPATAPAGSPVWASTMSGGVPIGTYMTAAGEGVSELSSTRVITATNTVGSVTLARLGNTTANVGYIDTDCAASGASVTVTAGGSSAGSSYGISAMSIKLPLTLGTVLLSPSLVNRLIDNLTAVNSGVLNFGISTSGASTFEIYGGTAPATAEDTPPSAAICTITIGASQVFTAAASGSTSLSAAQSATASGTGTATYARWKKTIGSIVYTIQGSVGTSGTDFILNTTSLTSGVTSVQLTDATMTM